MYASILINRSNSNIDKSFTYKVPDIMRDKATIGKRVVVPFGMGNEKLAGYIIELNENLNTNFKIKEIIDIVDDFPLFDLNTLELATFIKEKYICNYIDAINIAIPSGVRNINYDSIQEKYVNIAYEDINIDETMSKLANDKRLKTQFSVMEYIRNEGQTKISELKEKLGITDSAINTLIQKGIFKIIMQDKKANIYEPINIKNENIKLNEEQKVAIKTISNKIDKNTFTETLIHGVTGSGKTEVYIECVKRAIELGKQAIVLVPEIALTPQTVRRFKEHFGDLVVVTHSKMSDTEKYIEWNKVRKGEVQVMIGPRSAIFTPFSNIGIVIIDEEHETSYRSEITPKYDTKDIARYICSRVGAPLVYGSATPSIDTYYRTQNQEVELINMTKRVNDFMLPKIQIIDMKEELRNGNTSIISREAYEKINKAISEGTQILVLMNRRGFATFVSCRKCGHVMTCNNCDVPYVYHQGSETLECHHCGKIIHNVSICPECSSKYIKFFGVGTEKVEEELGQIFKNNKVIRMDADTTSKKNAHDRILMEFNSGNADILVGTQMIAKGHDFANVGLVLILAADAALNIQDYRAYEKAFQLFTQVAGRAGRTGKQSEVLIQTYDEKNYILECVKNYNYGKFYNMEIIVRESLGNPPFSNLITITFIGEDEKNIIIYINGLKKYLEYYNIRAENKYKILGPASHIIKKLKGKYRWKIIIKHEDEAKLKNFVLYTLDKFTKKEKMKDIKVQIDFS